MEDFGILLTEKVGKTLIVRPRHGCRPKLQNDHDVSYTIGTRDTMKTAKCQFLHPTRKSTIQWSATILASFRSLSNADSDAVERVEKFRPDQNLNFENCYFQPEMRYSSSKACPLSAGTDLQPTSYCHTGLKFYKELLHKFISG